VTAGQSSIVSTSSSTSASRATENASGSKRISANRKKRQSNNPGGHQNKDRSRDSLDSTIQTGRMDKDESSGSLDQNKNPKTKKRLTLGGIVTEDSWVIIFLINILF